MERIESPTQNNEVVSPGIAKAGEYADRIINGESYHSIINGLGPVMITSINEALERRGYTTTAFVTENTDTAIVENKETQKTDALHKYVEQIVGNRNPAVQELYANLLADKLNPEKRVQLAKALIADTYRKLRASNYQSNPNEENIWIYARTNQPVATKEQDNWIYRGYFGENSEKTITRGSFNVHVTTELITALDNYIASGAVKANYKFGAPNTPASPAERHDSISIYFLENPTKEVLDDLALIIKPYVRGNDLLGKKVSEGFYISEIGSVQEEHIKQLIDTLNTIDTAFANGVKIEMTHKERLAMSEAQFYALQKTALAFGYKITYHPNSGFVVELNNTGI